MSHSFYHHLCTYTVSKTFTCTTQCNVVAKSLTDSGAAPTPLLHNVKLINSASAQIYSCLFCAFICLLMHPQLFLKET